MYDKQQSSSILICIIGNILEAISMPSVLYKAILLNYSVFMMVIKDLASRLFRYSSNDTSGRLDEGIIIKGMLLLFLTIIVSGVRL